MPKTAATQAAAVIQATTTTTTRATRATLLMRTLEPHKNMSFNIFTRRRCCLLLTRQTKHEPKTRKTRAMRVA